MLGRYLIVILVIAGALVTAVAHKSSAPMSWPENDKASPLKFSHSFHITEAGVACADCHNAKESRLARVRELFPRQRCGLSLGCPLIRLR